MIPPQAWQAVSAENDVFERQIETKETLNGQNPNNIMNKKLFVFIQLVPVYLEQDDGSIVKKNT